MAQDVSPIERLQDQPSPVDPHAIEAEFSRVWRETASAGYDESSVRVRVLNLVAVASGPDDLDRFEETMDLLPERHPCRGIFAAAAPPDDELTATISAHCWRSGGRRHVCSEEVILRAGPAQQREVASAVLGLLVPELPVVVWLLGEPRVEDGLARRLLDDADRLLVDTARAADSTRTFASLLEAARTYDVDCSDVAWDRLLAWRSLTAQFFDGEERARELDRITSIEVIGANGTASSEPLLLAGWLASRLSLTPAEVTARDQHVDAVLGDGSRHVRLAIAPADADGPIQVLRIRTAGAALSIECHSDSGHLHVVEEWAGDADLRVVDQPPADDASMIAMALDTRGDTRVYEDAARMALSLLST